jgi:hypothetical protein
MLSASQLEQLSPAPKTAAALHVLLDSPRSMVPLLLQLAACEDAPGSGSVPSSVSSTPAGSPRARLASADADASSSSSHNSSTNGGDGDTLKALTLLLSQAASQPAPAQELVQGTLELLLAAQTDLARGGAMDNHQLEELQRSPCPLYLAPSATVCSDLSGGGVGGPWPPLDCPVVSSAVSDLLTNRGFSDSTQRRQFSDLFSQLMLAIFLRFVCKLRGAQPSELFPPGLLQGMYALVENNSLASHTPMQMVAMLMASSSSSSSSAAATGEVEMREALAARRDEFLRQCLARVPPEQELSVHFVYRLGLQWGRRETDIALLHLPVLLDRTLDEQAGELLAKLHHSDQALTAAIEALRRRAGTALARLRDHALPAYKQVASLGVDDDVLRWALRAADGEGGTSGHHHHHHSASSRHATTAHSLLQCDAESSNVLALLISQKLTHRSASQQAGDGWRRMSGKSNALLILYRALSKIR